MSIFSKIIAGEIPAHVVAESNEFLAFLDISPLAEGHVLVIPKKRLIIYLTWTTKLIPACTFSRKLWQQHSKKLSLAKKLALR